MKTLSLSVISFCILLLAACGKAGGETDAATSTQQDTTAAVQDPDITFAVDSLNKAIAEDWKPEIGSPLDTVYVENNQLVMELVTEKEIVEAANIKKWGASFVLNDFQVYGMRLLRAVMRNNMDVLIKYVNIDNTEETLVKATIRASDFKSHFGDVE